ncbi:MAG: lysophospholipid acyltransferase family protein [Pseudomonadota bacterium]
MISRMERASRVLATGTAFATFGVGGVLLQVVGMPLMFVLFPGRERRQRAARRAVHLLFRVFVGLLWAMGVLRFRMSDRARLARPGLIIVANHPTLLDVVFLLSAVPNGTCIVRAGLAHNPFTRAAVRSTGYVCNDWGVRLVDECIQALRAGSSLIVFPEGTRSNQLLPQKWQRGAAQIALRANVPLTPVRIGCEPPSLRKGEPWWQVPPRRMQYSFDVLDDLSVGDTLLKWGDHFLAARDLTNRLQKLLTQQVESDAGA